MKNYKLFNLALVFTVLFLASCSKDDDLNTIKSITVKANKEVFDLGEQLVITVGTNTAKNVTVDSKIFIDGKEATQPFKVPDKEGSYRIRATYGGFSSEATIKVEDLIASIEVTTDKSIFLPGEGITITVKTNEGEDVTDTSKILIDDKEVKKPYKVPTKTGDYKIKVNYKKYKDEFYKEITINVTKITAIPDQKFEQALIDLGYDDVIDGKVLTSVINKLTALNIVNKGIKDLTGIEDFTTLETLDVNTNQITNLDISKNTALTSLNCMSNQQLTSLDISKNTALTFLNCGSNKLTSLDVSKNTALVTLYCHNNQITSLDVNSNKSLAHLGCANNKLSNLDVSKNTALSWFNCSRNQITKLDLSKNTALSWLSCGFNRQLTSLDVSKSTKLRELYCYVGQITKLDVSKHTDLSVLNCSSNKIVKLDVGNSKKLKELYCGGNQITALDVSQNTALEKLYCDFNDIPSLSINKNELLTELICANNPMTSLDLRNGQNKKFTRLNFKNNPLLRCILVDDKSYSNASWSAIKDPTAKYIEKPSECN